VLPALTGALWARAFAGAPVGRDEIVRVLLIGDDEYDDLPVLVGQLRDGRWISVVVDDPPEIAVAEALHEIWWRLPFPPHELPEARAPIGCARCDHAAPHPCRVWCEGHACECDALDPIPGPLATFGWRLAFDAPAALVMSLDGTPAARLTRHDVAEVAYHDDGDGDGRPWIALLRLRDGRWAHVYRALGRDKAARHHEQEVTVLHAVAADLETLWWRALGAPDRERFAPRLAPAHRPMALVALDQLLGSDDPEVVARAEAQIARLRAAWGEG
jgi:hypothetical protein